MHDFDSRGDAVGYQLHNQRTYEEPKMTEFPSRDITGKCEGECKNIVLEADGKRQEAINASSVEYGGPSPSVPCAKIAVLRPVFSEVTSDPTTLKHKKIIKK